MVKAEAADAANENSHKSFVVSILTSKSRALKILQDVFAKPARQSRHSEGVGEGVPQNQGFSRNGLPNANV